MAAVGALTALLAGATATAAGADPIVTGGDTAINYTEQGAPIPVGQGITVSSTDGTTVYGGGYIDFDVNGGTGTEILSLAADAAPDTTSGTITIVGNTVYRGNGTTADVIGSVDETYNGSNGHLRVDFTSPFSNSSFEDSSLAGWTPVNSRVDLGVTQLPPGHVAQDSGTYPSTAPNQDNDVPSSATYNVNIANQGSDGSHSLQLVSDMTTAQGCDVVHGPAVYSDPFPASAGDQIYFDWRAFAGSDAYDVFGYIVDANGVQTNVLDATGSTSSNTDWTTKQTTIPRDGSYRFVFVAGTFDATCGRAAGASLLIDNVRVFGTKADDAAATAIAHKLLYQNTSNAPAPDRTISVTAVDGQGKTDSSDVASVATQAVDDPPTLGSIPPLVVTNTSSPDDHFANVPGQLNGSDPDSTGLHYGIQDGATGATTIDGTTYDVSKQGTYGTLYLDSATGAYVYVPDDAAVNGRYTSGSDSFTVEAISADDSSDGGGDKTTSQSLQVDVTVPATPPGSPTDLVATPGNGTVDLSWTAPTWIGGDPVSGYQVEETTDGGETWTTVVENTGTDDTSYTVGGLDNGTPVAFRVSAINDNGTGTPNDDGGTVVGVTPETVAGAPTGLTTVPGDGTVTLGWTAPTENGGAAVTGYRVETSTDGGDEWHTAIADTGSDATTATVDGLINGVDVQFRVIALNDAGAGEPSDEQTSTPRTVAGQTTITSVTAGNHSLTVDFAAPTDNGGSGITGYEYSLDGGDTWIPVDGGVSPLVVTGLANDHDYSLTLRAVNAAGDGAASTVTTASPKATPILTSGSDGPQVPELKPGTADLSIDGTTVPVTISDEDGVWTATGDGFVITLTVVNTDGKKTALDPDGNLIVVQNDSFEVSGSGFQPNSTVDVWLFSTPALLGVAEVDGDGDFTGTYQLPAGTPVGTHTLQVNGLSPAGELRTLNTGVTLQATPAALASTGVDDRRLGLLTAVFLLLAAVGTMLVVTARRRRRRA